VCKKPLSGHDKEKLVKELSEEKEKTRKKILEFEEKEKRANGLLKNLKEKLGETNQKKKELEKVFNELERIHEIVLGLGKKEKQAKDLEEELKKILEMREKSPFDEKKLEEARKQFYEAKEKKSQGESGLKHSKEMIRELKESLKRIRENAEQIKKLQESVKHGEKNIEKVAVFTSALKSTQAELRNTMVETINQAMEEIWPRVYPYNDFQNVKMMVEEGSYEIMVKQRNEEWQRVDGILSGGERSSVAITLRIAISLVLTQNLGWIILDEPTHNLDSTAVRELSETMRNHLPELIEQIFIITHDKDMENAASGKLYSFEREKEKDGPTRVDGA